VLRLSCPACGLYLQVRLIAPEHCPRCLARRATAVSLVLDPSSRTDTPGSRPRVAGVAADSNLINRVMAGLRVDAPHGRSSVPPAVGGRPMNEFSRSRATTPLERGDSPESADREVVAARVLSDRQRATHGEIRTADRIMAALELARAETAMDVAVLGEIRDGREVARGLAGDAQSFGLTIGLSTPLENTYCEHLLAGRLGNIVHDARADERVRDLELTREARIGAYVGVPLTAFDARLYVLCCLAHEQRPSLSERDVRFLRGLSETIIAALDAPATE
jgi:hypothetical protein